MTEPAAVLLATTSNTSENETLCFSLEYFILLVQMRPTRPTKKIKEASSSSIILIYSVDREVYDYTHANPL